MKRYLILALVLLAVLAVPVSAVNYHYNISYGSSVCVEYNLGSIYYAGWGYQPPTYPYQSFTPTQYRSDYSGWTTTKSNATFEYRCVPMPNYTAFYMAPNNGTGWDLRPEYGSMYYLGAFYSATPSSAFMTDHVPGETRRNINYTFMGSLPSTLAWASDPSADVVFSNPTGTSGSISFPGDGPYNISVTSTIGAAHSTSYKTIEFSGSAPPVAGYSCNFDPMSPYRQTPYNLYCWDASTGSVTRRNWTLSQPDASKYLTGNISLVKQLTQTGWYGLNYEACNDAGCGYTNTSTLINISSTGPETGISFWVHTYDPITGAKIGPSDIGIGNVTSGGWRNSSTNLGTAKFDSTDYARLEKLTVGQNVNLCGEAPGYRETCTNVSIAYDGWEYILNLVRTDLVPAGNQSTMIVNVINSNTAQTIPGVSLTISNSSVPYSSSKLSDSNGIATFSNIPAAGSYQIAASKTGYVSATKFWPVYPGQVSNAYIGMLPVGVTPVTTGPGGDPIYITPTTTTTYAPGETPDTRTDAEKDEDMMGLLRDQGPMLIQFFIVCFVVYMVMGMAGKGGR